MPPQIPAQDPQGQSNNRPTPAAPPPPVPAPAPAPVPPAPAPIPAPPPAPATQSGAGHVDFDKLVLKRKDAPSVDSARRVNAGALLEQEQNATLLPPQAARTEPAPAQTPPQPEQALVKPLQTYQGDIASLVDQNQVSIVSIASAEARRRGEAPLQEGRAPLNQQEGRPWLYRGLLWGGGVLMLCAAGGIALYLYSSFQSVPISEQFPAPFIAVDDTQTVTLEPGDTRGLLMRALVAARDAVSLSLGLIARLQVVEQTAAGDGTLQEVGAPELLQLLAPRIPPELVRTLEPQMLLGVHSFDENQAFMILKADSFETAWAGMLAWEQTMQTDLSPLFSRTPPVRPKSAVPTTPMVVPASTTTSSGQAGSATSTTNATTTAATSTTPQVPEEPARFFLGNFVDQIVQNRDARVVLNSQGDILLLWVMLDRSTIVITTNDATLREVVSRLSQSSILSLPSAN